MRSQTAFIIVGILLFVLGLGLALYEKVETYRESTWPYRKRSEGSYPHQALGIVILLIGCGIASLGIYQHIVAKPKKDKE